MSIVNAVLVVTVLGLLGSAILVVAAQYLGVEQDAGAQATQSTPQLANEGGVVPTPETGAAVELPAPEIDAGKERAPGTP